MKKAIWIWNNAENRPDEYVKFYDTFEKVSGGNTFIDISCDSNYTLYVNGQLAAYGQYADYPHYKVYDKIDLTPYLKEGKNVLSIIVWYYGIIAQTYAKANAGLIYEVYCGNNILAFSSEKTKNKIASDYVPYRNKSITGQLGQSFMYDTRQYDGFDRADYRPEGFSRSVKAEVSDKLNLRPIKSLYFSKKLEGKLIDKEKRIYDLGMETAGFLEIKFKAKSGKVVTISFGEHIADGFVRRIIGERDFSVEIIGNGEMFEYLNTFRRLGCRYLQIEGECEIEYIGIRETSYPVSKIPFKAKSELQQRIYDTCVRTLELCMHEHYEDCPWREQALYCMDSRNQMLCGYYAFGEYEFPRANLLLMSKAQKADKLLPLCFPSGKDYPIPFFSLMYIVQMNEYASYSGDVSLLRECISLLEDIVSVFIGKIEENGIIKSFKDYWNFYEWSDGLFNELSGDKGESYDLPLNCFVILALQNMNEIYSKLGISKDFNKEAEGLRKACYKHFYVEEKGLFKTYINDIEHYSKLSNSLAVLSGAAMDKSAEICEKLVSDSNEMIDVTLSMKVFQYDALLKVSQKYKDFIECEIEKNYKYMLDCGATTFWETLLGEADFGNAGSLCHGWSAVPIYYFNLFAKR